MRFFHSVVFLLICAPGALAQMSPAQRTQDFEQLAGFVSRAYAPYQWKIDAFGYDAFHLAPWLSRVADARSDLEYFELCAEYIASLRDLHSGFSLPSDFVASIPIGVDLYDGRPLIDSIDRTRIPVTLYPFQIGDELISVDSEPVSHWIFRVSRLQSFANPRATSRWALDQIFYRTQAAIPRAPQINDFARIVIRRKITGDEETYEIPWTVTGTPYTVTGPVPTPQVLPPSLRDRRLAASGLRADEAGPPRRFGAESLAVRRVPEFKRLRGLGSVRPAFQLPPDFVVRQGNSPGSLIFSGTYLAGDYRIGYLRIPSFPSSPFTASTMLRQIDTEIEFFNLSVHGLVVDVMRNPGGSVCLTNDILSRLIPIPFRTIGDQFRPTYEVVQIFRDDLQFLIDVGAGSEEVMAAEEFLHEIETAYYGDRGITAEIPACGYSLEVEPARKLDGSLLAFKKPAMLVLIDEFSASAADAFPAVLQDANRALMFGKRTAGGGGLIYPKPVGIYSEAFASLSISLGVRLKESRFYDIPPTRFLENAGAWTDFDYDIMTEANLLNNGRPFVDAFTQKIIEHIIRSQK